MRRCHRMLFGLAASALMTMGCNLSDPDSADTGETSAQDASPDLTEDTADMDTDISSPVDMTPACEPPTCQPCAVDTECTAPPRGDAQCWEATCADGACTYTVQSGHTCAAATCSEDGLSALTERRCDDDGTCPATSPKTCAPFLCADEASACATTCEDASVCQPTFNCIDGACARCDISIDADIAGADLLTTINDAFVDQAVDLRTCRVTIADDVTLSAPDATLPALTIPPLPNDMTVFLINEGRILGRGGAGGSAKGDRTPAFSQGESGGDALRIAEQPAGVLVRIDNHGIIAGGGGGGGAGWASIPTFPPSGLNFGGGGGAGAPSGAGGGAVGARIGNFPGQAGTDTKGGIGGNSSSFVAGPGGDLGRPGLSARGTQSSGEVGAAGHAVVGFDQPEWLSEGTLLGPTTP